MITIKLKRKLLQILVSFTLENFYTNKQVNLTIKIEVKMILFQATEESNVALAVRSHRTLELAGDNFYVITCGRSGWRDSVTNESTTVRLTLTSEGRKITEATYGRDYQLQAEMDAPSGV